MNEYTQEQYEKVESTRFDLEEKSPASLTTKPAVPAFPVDALPAWWGQYVAGLAESSQTPVDMAGAVTLGVLAATIGGRHEIEPTPGWVEPTNLYTVVALDPGNRKSAVFSKATAPLKEIERELITEQRPIVAEQQARYDLLLEKADRAKRDALKNDDPGDEAHYLDLTRQAAETVVPALPRLLADDATPEAIASLAAQQGGRIAIAAPEGGIFDIFAGRYTGGIANNEVLLRGHAGDSFTIDRKGRESEHIDKLTLTFILTVQPSVLRQIGSSPVEKSRGELERFLYSVPFSNVGHRNTRPRVLSKRVQAAWDARVMDQARASWAIPEPAVLSFDEDAQEAFYDWLEEVEHMLGPDGELGEPRLIGWGSKLAGTTARIAAIMHLAEGRGTSPVSVEHVENAIKVARYFIGHAKAAFHLMQVSDQHVMEKKLIHTLRRHRMGTFTTKSLFDAVSRSVFAKTADVQAVLDSLAELDWVARVEMPERSGAGRKPSPTYVAHPDIFGERTPSAKSAKSAKSVSAGNSADSADSAEPPRAVKSDLGQLSPECEHGVFNGLCFPCMKEKRAAS